ncbi:MAG: type II toxin-antitoxin system VapC family toxin [Planctomycetes bacterium]|nr:type II toxin-antitoxin system VapC family toxin [Planctomycetota bacterium]
MNSFVIDASVAAAAFGSYPHVRAAREIIFSDRTLWAPEFMYVEAANVIWKRVRCGELSSVHAAEMLDDVLNLSIQTVASEELIESALQLAMGIGRSVYDCLYIALAVRMKTVMITCDQRLANAMAKSNLKNHIALLEVKY